MTAIRRAFDADADGIRRVARAAWHDAYDSLDSEVIDETISDWYADPLGSALHGWAGGVPANDLDDIEATLLVADQDGEIIGSLRVSLAYDGNDAAAVRPSGAPR